MRRLALVTLLTLGCAAVIGSPLSAQNHGVQPLCVSGCGGPGPSPVSVTPRAGADTVPANGARDSVAFTVKNTGTQYTDTYSLTMSCTSLTCPTDSMPNPNPLGPLALGPGASTTVYVKFSHPTSPTSGRASLTAADTINDYRSTGIWNVVGVAQGPATIALHNFNGVDQDRSLCLTLGAGQAAGLACGDLFVIHSLPSYRTMSRDRQLTLFYSAATAAPRPTVAVWATEPAGTQTPTSVFAQLTVNGVVRASATYSPWGAGGTRQIALAYDASGDASGLYAFTLLVRNQYTGSSYDATVSDTLMVANRSTSEFGAGWWPAGVERLVLAQPGNRILWLDGDGSAAAYDSVAAHTWVRAAGPFRDTLSYASGSQTYTRTLRHRIQVTFDATGRHLTTVNRAGNTTTFTWSGSPLRLTSIQVPPGGSGTSYSLVYDGAGNIYQLYDPAGRILWAIVSGGNLTQLCDADFLICPSGGPGSLGYDAAHRMTSRTGRRGYATRYYYTNGLHVDSVHIPLKPGALQPYDTARTRVTWWDEQGLAIGVYSGTPPTLDSSRTFTQVKDPRTDVVDTTNFWVDRWGAPVKIVDPLGHTTVLTRSTSTGLVSRLQNPVGNVWGMTYTSRGNDSTVTDSTHEGQGGGFLAATTRYYYTNSNPVTQDSPDSVIDPQGVTTRYAYNSLDLDSLVTAPNGQQTRYRYATGGLAGLLDSVTALQVRTTDDSITFNTTNKDQTTALSYNSLGNLVSTITPKGSVTQYAYNSYTQDTSVTDAVGNRTRYQWGVMGELDQQTPVGPQTRYTNFQYDMDFNLLCENDARAVGRCWGYDAADRDTSLTDDFGNTEIQWHDPSGLLDSVRTRDSVVVHRVYDAAGRLTQLWFPPNAPGDSARGDTVNYTYDAAGHLLTAQNRTGTVTRQYYREGTLKQSRDTVYFDPLHQYSVLLQYQYNLDNQRSLYADVSWGGSDTVGVSYRYAAGLLDTVVINYPTGTPPDTAAYTWDGLERRQQVMTPHHGAHVTISWFYDSDGNLRRIYSTHAGTGHCVSQDSALVDVQFKSYDPDDRPRRISQSVGHTAVMDSSDFNAFGEEIYQDDGLTTPRRLSYDASGNLISSVDTLNGVRYGKIFVMRSYPMHNELLQDSVATNGGPYLNAFYSFDKSGRRILDYALDPNAYRSMYYDALGRMTTIISVVSTLSGPQDANPVTNIVNGNHTTQSSVVISEVDGCRYDALGRRVRPCGSGDWPEAYDGDAVVRVGGVRIIYGAGLDDPIAIYDTLRNAAHVQHYFLTDGAGRLLSYTDASGCDQRGNLSGNYIYGQHAIFAGAIASGHTYAASAAQSPATPELGFFHNRYYDQRTGRWMQEDPIGPAGGVNLYEYVGNNPATYTDPFGLQGILGRLLRGAISFLHEHAFIRVATQETAKTAAEAGGERLVQSAVNPGHSEPRGGIPLMVQLGTSTAVGIGAALFAPEAAIPAAVLTAGIEHLMGPPTTGEGQASVPSSPHQSPSSPAQTDATRVSQPPRPPQEPASTIRANPSP